MNELASESMSQRPRAALTEHLGVAAGEAGGAGRHSEGMR